jgi:HK97 gp10 family phage protein
VKVDVQVRGLDGVLDMLKKLPPEVVSRRGGPVKAALRKGALVIQREAALNLARATDTLAEDGERGTGLLLQNLVVTRGKEPIGTKGERYLVRVRRKSYLRKGKPVTTLKTAHLLEYGSSQQPAEPWLRPAFAARATEAIKTIEREMIAGLDRAVRKLARKGGR